MRAVLFFLLLCSTCFGELNAADYPTFRDAVIDCVARQENVLRVPRRINSSYVLEQPLPAWPSGRLIIQGEGDNSMIYLRGDGAVCIEGCILKLRDVRVYGDPVNPPRVGVAFRRMASGDRKAHSINGCGLRDVTVNGSFRGAAVLVLCAEGSCISDSRINNLIGHGLIYDTNDRIGCGYITDTGSFTNSGHSLHATELAVWNSAADQNKFPLLIGGNTDSVVAQGLYTTAQGCRAYVAVESYPGSYNRANVPRWNTLESSGWETLAGKEPYFGIVYRRLGGQIQYGETLKKVPAIRWQSGPASGQETVP